MLEKNQRSFVLVFCLTVHAKKVDHAQNSIMNLTSPNFLHEVEQGQALCPRRK